MIVAVNYLVLPLSMSVDRHCAKYGAGLDCRVAGGAQKRTRLAAIVLRLSLRSKRAVSCVKSAEVRVLLSTSAKTLVDGDQVIVRSAQLELP